MQIPDTLIKAIFRSWQQLAPDLFQEFDPDNNESAIDAIIDCAQLGAEGEQQLTYLIDEHGFMPVLKALAAHPRLQLV